MYENITNQFVGKSIESFEFITTEQLGYSSRSPFTVRIRLSDGSHISFQTWEAKGTIAHPEDFKVNT